MVSDYYPRNNNSGMTKWIILLVIGVGIYFYLQYTPTTNITSITNIDPVYNTVPRINQSLLDSDNDSVINKNDICPNTPQNTTANEDGCNKEQAFELIPVNACGSKYYGLPDYAGTTKEGDKCTDVPIVERDLECVANPPLTYDGEINGAYSNPTLFCCFESGECTW